MTVPDIAKLIRGTKENNYSDGILGATRVGAVRLARTVVNGVSNNARVETIKANSDVIDGIKFVGTLDGKTCSYCAAYDGQIWRGEDMATARRPPIHPNCRCTLVPYVELKDDEGNVVDIDNDRPAANADFDALARDAYNEKAKEKGWKRRFEDLSPSTRLKYYYQAQKDYEARTGKPAYRQVDSNLSFQDYFKQQPDSFKREWLGAKRYDAYKAGKLTEKAIFTPDLSYTISPTSLVKFVEPDTPETLDKLIKKYEKKRTEENALLGEADSPYEPISFSFDGSSSRKELSKRWLKLSLDEIPDIFNEVQKKYSEWKILISAKQPKREDYSSEQNFAQARRLWTQDKKDGDYFWKSLLVAIEEVKIDLRLQKKKEFVNPFSSIMTPEEYSKKPEVKKRLKQIENEYKENVRKFGYTKANALKADSLRDLLLPLKPDEKSVAEIMKKLPKNGFALSFSMDKATKDKFNEDKAAFVEATKKGLENVARVLVNLGWSVDDIKDVRIGPIVLQRGGTVDLLVNLSYKLGNPQDAKRVCEHEFGHGAVNSHSDIKQKEIEIYEKHSVKDKDGNYIYEQLLSGKDEKARKLDFETPDSYTRREYLDPAGNVRSTELTSKFFEYITEQPWLFFDQKYETYFTEMVNLWKKTN